MRRAIIQVFTGNVTSKFLGIGREVLTAALFGTGPVIGAFRVAQTGTLVPVNFFTSDVLNAAFIPQYRKLQTISWDKSQVLLWSLLSMFVTLAMLIGLALWVSATPWITALAPGLETDAASQAAMMLQIMAVGVPPYLLGALLIFVGMANDDFVPMAIRPALQNLGLIIGALTAFVLHDVRFLAGGFTASYMVFCVWVLVRTFRSGLLYWPGTWDWPLVDEVMRAFWRTLRPLLLMPFMLQGNIVVERAVASVIGLAAISALDYARFITETLIILISVPVAYAGLTHWSGLSVNVIRQRLHKVLLLMLVVAVPASAFLAAHAHTIVEAIYARGSFDVASVHVTGDILFGMALGLWAQIIGYVLIRALNAQMRNRAVVWVMAAALLTNTSFNLTMYPYLDAMTLGLGNSTYGLVLLGGTLSVLGLWKDAFQASWFMASGAAGYMLLSHWLPPSEGVWSNLLLASGFALIYWMIWIALVPLLRHTVIEAIAPEWRKMA